MKALPLIIAAAGGACPTLVALANKLLIIPPGRHMSDFIQFPGLLLGMLLLAGLGGLVALVFQETDLRKAFVLGISAPAFITSAISTAQNSATGPATSLPSSKLPSPI